MAAADRDTRERWAEHWVRAHVWAGVLAGVLVTMPTSLAEIAVIPPLLVGVLLIPWTRRLWLDALKSPVAVLLLLFGGWLALGLLWSPDRGLGIEEVGNLRFFAGVLLLLPAQRLTPTGRGRLIAAMAAGFLAGNIVQALNAWAVLADGPAVLRFGRAADRLSGWWDPAVAGTILTAALGLHLPAALMGTGRSRVVALGGAGATIFALLATGSRGGWIASAGLLAIAGVVSAVRAYRTRTGASAAAMGLAVLVVVAGFGVFVFRGEIGHRLSAAREQVARAVEGQYGGDDGARIAMKRAALGALAAHPIVGVGTGGYAHWAREHFPGAAEGIHDHAHDTLLHTAAGNGLIGAGLLLAVAVAGLVGGVRWARRCGWGTYAAGPVFALVGLMLTTPFDTLHVSASAAAVTGFVLALCAANLGPFEFVGRGLFRRRV